MSKTIDDILKQLDENIPENVVSERDGGGGRRLSYLEGHYVIDRLNKVLGHLNWSKEITDVRLLDSPKPSYIVKVRLVVHTASGQIIKEGYGYGSDKSANNPHELAIKEAVTDALKVAAKDLGQSMGLALYDKTQKNVGESIDVSIQNKSKQSKKSAIKETQSSVGQTSDKSSSKENETQSPTPSRSTLEETIKSYVRIGAKLGKLTVDGFKKDLNSKYSADTLAALNTSQLTEVLSNVKQLAGGANGQH